jgi:hypothetical protein
MAATLVGTTGIHGAADETALGIITESFEDTTRSEKNFQKNHIGERTGHSDFDDSVEWNLSGSVTFDNTFDVKLSSEIALGNTIITDSLLAGAGGMNLLFEVKRTRKNDGWAGIAINGELLPYYEAP